MKAFFLSGLVTALYKQAGVPLMDSEEVLSMDPPFYPLLVKPAYSKGKKKRRWVRPKAAEKWQR